MSGYFERLLARGRGGGAGIRPFRRPAYATTFTAVADGDAMAAAQRLPDQPVSGDAVANQPSTASTAGVAVRTPASVDDAMPFAPPGIESSRVIVADGEPGGIASHLSQLESTLALPQRGDEWGGDTGAQGAVRAADTSPPVTLAGHDEFRLLPPVSAHAPNAARSAMPATMPVRDPARATDPYVGGRRDAPAASETTEIHVSIGRIEVTAVSAPDPPKHKPAAGPKAMSLDDYLSKRQRERT
ncbi:MAG: hypothetical protein ACSLE5_10530 [Porticoccaceae bacterium]